ncbi:MAG: lyase family protein [Roseibium sp.]|uniref:lyase family protein n=1 Tax=Roseibium sp. TaxID=1936156 RepID=UPI003D9C06D2
MPVSLFSSQIHSGLFSDEELAVLFGDDGDVAHMIRFERALAVVQGRLGIIPADAATKIGDSLRDAKPDPASLRAGTITAGVPVPALVAELRKIAGDEAGTWIHWGATSQDVMDTAQMLQAKTALGILQTRLDRLIDTLEAQSNRHEDQLLAGRTRSQVSTPVTLGYRIAQWAHPLIDARNDLAALCQNAHKVQFGGASGVNSAIAPDGTRVAEALASELGLSDAPSWHVNRTPILLQSGWLQRVCIALSKMAGDLIVMGRSDIRELASGTGGGSSTMPQKSNPVQAETIQVLAQVANHAHRALAAAADPLEERDGSKWPLEWMMLPQTFVATGAALNHAQELTYSLRPDEEQLDATLAVNPEIMAEAASFALAKAGVSRAEAKDLVAQAAAASTPFPEALASLSTVRIDWNAALDPATAIAPCKAMSRRIFEKRSNG